MPVNRSLDDFQKPHSPAPTIESDPLLSIDAPSETFEDSSEPLFTIVYAASQPGITCTNCGSHSPHYWLEETQYVCEKCKVW